MPATCDIQDLDNTVLWAAGVTDERAGKQYPDDAAILADVPLLQLIGVDLAGPQSRRLLQIARKIVWMGDGLKRSAQQLVFWIADQLAQSTIDLHEPPVQGDEGHA